ncbi:MAG: hypothetical protein V1811_01560 [Candidatus Micrarchaeota archaeon]
MKKPLIAIKNPREGKIAELAKKTSHKTLALWALDCAERVLPFFEKKCLKDKRPRIAIETGRAWVKTGVFKMAVIRKASLDAHAAARDVKEDDVARSAARAAGQAVATAHVPTHALAAAAYAATVFRDAAKPENAEDAVAKERAWQYEHLRGFSISDSAVYMQKPLISVIMKTAYVFGPIHLFGQDYLPVYKRLTKLCGKYFGKVIGTYPDFWDSKESPREFYDRTIKTITKCDLLIGEVSSPSLGVGMEFQMAVDHKIPIIALAKEGTDVSIMVLGVPNLQKLIRYRDVDDLVEKLETELIRLASQAKRAKR